jgi:polar amino acid transport system substrate-binding protein
MKRYGYIQIRSICAKILILFIFFGALVPHVVMSQETKKLVFVSARPTDDIVLEQLSEVYTKILKLMGIEFEYKNLPARRASEASNSGEVDGELTRVYSYNDKYTNLIRVEEANHQAVFAAYAVKPEFSFKGWESLKGYNIDCRRGIKVCVNNVSRVTMMYEINTVEQIVMRLKNGYSDAFVTHAGHFDDYMKSDLFVQMDKEKEIRKAGVMQIITAHAFLHKKHKALVPQISELLKQMKQTGEYQRIRGWPKDRMK